MGCQRCWPTLGIEEIERRNLPCRDQCVLEGGCVQCRDYSLADKLDWLQQRQNNWRGISCVRTVVFYLRKGDISSAQATVNNESDKIRSYPDIVKVIQDSSELSWD